MCVCVYVYLREGGRESVCVCVWLEAHVHEHPTPALSEQQFASLSKQKLILEHTSIHSGRLERDTILPLRTKRALILITCKLHNYIKHAGPKMSALHGGQHGSAAHTSTDR